MTAAAAEIDFAELGEQLAGLLDRHAAAREKSGWDDDPILGELLRRIQADESLHLAFYRDAVKAALAQQPALAAEVVDEIERFREPVTVLPDYEQRKEAIWQAGISNLEVFRQQVIAPLVAYWDIAEEAVDRRWLP